MALTISLVLTLIAVANAGFVWVDDNAKSWNPFEAVKLQMPKMVFPTFPTLPTPPRLPTFQNGFPFSFIGWPSMMTPGDIAKMKPGPNQYLNAVAVQSSSRFGKDSQGNPINEGGTTIMLNENGKVKEIQSGKNPPDPNKPIVFPTLRF